MAAVTEDGHVERRSFVQGGDRGPRCREGGLGLAAGPGEIPVSQGRILSRAILMGKIDT